MVYSIFSIQSHLCLSLVGNTTHGMWRNGYFEDKIVLVNRGQKTGGLSLLCKDYLACCQLCISCSWKVYRSAVHPQTWWNVMMWEYCRGREEKKFPSSYSLTYLTWHIAVNIYTLNVTSGCNRSPCETQTNSLSPIPVRVIRSIVRYPKLYICQERRFVSRTLAITTHPDKPWISTGLGLEW